MAEEGDLMRLDVSSDPGVPYYALVTWKRDHRHGLNLSLTDCRAAWTGEVSGSKLEEEASEAGLSLDDYVAELRAALGPRPAPPSGPPSARPPSLADDTFRFDLKPAAGPGHGLHKRFSICKTHSDVTFELGTVDVSAAEEPVALVRRMLEHGLRRGRQLLRRNDELLRDNEGLAAERAGAIAELQESVLNKEELERDLYGKFVRVLNDKKEKIRKLTEALDTHPAAPAPADPTARDGTIGGTVSTQRAGSPDASDYEGTTDEDSPTSDPGTSDPVTSARQAATAPDHAPVSGQEGERRDAFAAFDPYDDDDGAGGAEAGGGAARPAGALPARRQRKRLGREQATAGQATAAQATAVPPPAKARPANDSRATRRGAPRAEAATTRHSLRKATRGSGGSDTLELLYDF